MHIATETGGCGTGTTKRKHMKGGSGYPEERKEITTTIWEGSVLKWFDQGVEFWLLSALLHEKIPWDPFLKSFLIRLWS